MFGIGLTEMILVGLVALMLFSPRELPGVIKTLARVYGSIRRTAEQFRSQVMEAEELREPIDEIRAAYHGTRAELDSAKDLARRELQRARTEVLRAQQKINEIAREEAKRPAELAAPAAAPAAPAPRPAAPVQGDRVVATGPSEQASPASAPLSAVPPPLTPPLGPVGASSPSSAQRDVA